MPVDGVTVPQFEKEELEKFPEGYRYLGLAQEKLGHRILKDLPTMNNEGFDTLRRAMDAWLRADPVAGILGIPEGAEERF